MNALNRGDYCNNAQFAKRVKPTTDTKRRISLQFKQPKPKLKQKFPS